MEECIQTLKKKHQEFLISTEPASRNLQMENGILGWDSLLIVSGLLAYLIWRWFNARKKIELIFSKKIT